MPILSLLVAATDERVIGRDNKMPWHLPADLRRFRLLSMGKPVVMGRKTHESIGKPLPGRRNIVLTRNPAWCTEGCETVTSLDAALALAPDAEEIVIIGGGEIFRLALPLADRLYYTHIHSRIPGDAWFPEVDWRQWQAVRHEAGEDGDLPYEYVDYNRVRSPG